MNRYMDTAGHFESGGYWRDVVSILQTNCLGESGGNWRDVVSILHTNCSGDGTPPICIYVRRGDGNLALFNPL